MLVIHQNVTGPAIMMIVSSWAQTRVAARCGLYRIRSYKYIDLLNQVEGWHSVLFRYPIDDIKTGVCL
jgi:hypothetical protein